MRILRLASKSKSLKLLIDTLLFVLPSLGNVSALLFLFFFIFYALGLNLFGTALWWDYITFDANFSEFGKAILMMYRCTTGENWN